MLRTCRRGCLEVQSLRWREPETDTLNMGKEDALTLLEMVPQDHMKGETRGGIEVYR